VTLIVLPTPFALTRTPSIGPAVSELTRPARAKGARSFGLAANGLVTLTQNTNAQRIILNMILFLESG
jgi:hypothetical protein